MTLEAKHILHVALAVAAIFFGLEIGNFLISKVTMKTA